MREYKSSIRKINIPNSINKIKSSIKLVLIKYKCDRLARDNMIKVVIKIKINHLCITNKTNNIIISEKFSQKNNKRDYNYNN